MTTLILIRHGESEANEKNIYIGQTDADLTERGKLQAQLTAKYVTQNYHVDAVYGSDLQRAFKTGKAVADLLNMEIQPRKGLREINAGKWEEIPFDDLETQFAKEYSVWLSDIGNAACVGGESVREMAKRVLAAITEIARENDGKTVVLATHATPIRAMMCLWKGLTLNEMKDVPWVNNASVTIVEYERGTYRVVQTGEDGHLEGLRTVLPDNV